MTEPNESSHARLTRWLRQRPTSLEFWELLVTDKRVVWCFVSESFKSLLLRADTSERGRREIERSTPERAMSLDERNFAVPLDSLRSIRLREGTRFRRAVLTLTWREDDDTTSIKLYATHSSDSQIDTVEALRDVSSLSHVDIEVETARGLL